jgi:hypothetical protein
MTIKRLDDISVVVDDRAIAFLTALGMTREGEMLIDGPWVDRVSGLERVQVDIVMMWTYGRLDLTYFRNPKLARSNRRIARRPARFACSTIQRADADARKSPVQETAVHLN